MHRSDVRNAAACRRTRFASRSAMHRSNVRNAPKLRKGAKLDNQNPKVDGVKGSIAPLAGCRGGAPAGV
ncbi:MAG: hypothetical protein IJ906_06855 [Oscillospiraceae bacterium]|nr:hypothetical protein [Oscillospiraceae bacterium]